MRWRRSGNSGYDHPANSHQRQSQRRVFVQDRVEILPTKRVDLAYFEGHRGRRMGAVRQERHRPQTLRRRRSGQSAPDASCGSISATKPLLTMYIRSAGWPAKNVKPDGTLRSTSCRAIAARLRSGRPFEQPGSADTPQCRLCFMRVIGSQKAVRSVPGPQDRCGSALPTRQSLPPRGDIAGRVASRFVAGKPSDAVTALICGEIRPDPGSPSRGSHQQPNLGSGYRSVARGMPVKKLIRPNTSCAVRCSKT